MALLVSLPVAVVPPKQRITELYIAGLKDFTTLQNDTDGVIAVAHVFPVDNGFYKMPLNPMNQGQLKFDTTGEYPISKEQSVVTANIVGLSIEQILMIQAMKGETLIALVKDGNCGAGNVRWQVGCQCYPATLNKAEYDTDTLTLKLEFMSGCLPLKYTASITLAA